MPHFDMREPYLLQYVEMRIITNDEISTSCYCTINKFIIIRVLFYQVKTILRIYQPNVPAINQHSCSSFVLRSKMSSLKPLQRFLIPLTRLP